MTCEFGDSNYFGESPSTKISVDRDACKTNITFSEDRMTVQAGSEVSDKAETCKVEYGMTQE